MNTSGRDQTVVGHSMARTSSATDPQEFVAGTGVGGFNGSRTLVDTPPLDLGNRAVSGSMTASTVTDTNAFSVALIFGGLMSPDGAETSCRMNASATVGP